MGRELILSRRLTALTEMVTPGSKVCDVGCDHGFLSIYLVQKGISPRVIAMDVRRGPLSRAQEHIREYGLEQYIETRLSDGLNAYEAGQAQSLVCAGMGGRLMQRILVQGRGKAQGFKELILQPQSEIPSFRKFLREEGYETVQENMIEEEGKFYFLMRAVPVSHKLPCRELLYDLFGEQLLKTGHPVLKRYLDYRQKETAAVLDSLADRDGDRIAERARQLEEEMIRIRKALEFFTAASE